VGRIHACSRSQQNPKQQTLTLHQIMKGSMAMGLASRYARHEQMIGRNLPRQNSIPWPLVALLVVTIAGAWLAAGQAITIGWLASFPGSPDRADSAGQKLLAFAGLALVLAAASVAIAIHILRRRNPQDVSRRDPPAP